MANIHDVIIIGAGPAGLTAGLYAGRSRLDTIIIEKGQNGGQISITDSIENYPGGALEGESGAELSERMAAQAKKFGAQFVSDSVKSVELSGDVKKITGTKGEYLAKSVIIATGAYPRPIGCENEDEFRGRGVSFCATCDGAFFTGLEVYVIGGGDAAVEEALFLTRFARKVTIIHRRDELRAAKSIQEKAFREPKIEFMWNTVVQRLDGDGVLSSMTVKDVKTGEIREIKADPNDGVFGVFVFIGMLPETGVFEGKLDMDKGYIITDENMKTSVPGVFAAGDCRVKSLRQVVTAVGDGAVAAVQAGKYIDECGASSGGILRGRKLIVIGDSDGISAEDMLPCAAAAGGEVIYSSTECFACSVTGSIDQTVQREIIKLCERNDPKDITVLLGVSDPDSAKYTAETLISGDSSGFGPLSGKALGLDVRHICDPELRGEFSDAYGPALKLGESAMNISEVLENIEKMKK